jgi:hypothetical protein
MRDLLQDHARAQEIAAKHFGSGNDPVQGVNPIPLGSDALGHEPIAREHARFRCPFGEPPW